MANHSDLRLMYAPPSQNEPLRHWREGRIKPIGSFNSKALKLAGTLCQPCNTTRTQPFDRAWEELSRALYERWPGVRVGDDIRTNRIFWYDTWTQMLRMHLFFLKLWGCHMFEKKATAFGLEGFANAIQNETAHPHVYIRFGVNMVVPKRIHLLGCGDMHADMDSADKTCRSAIWTYYVDRLALSIIYAQPGHEPASVKEAWHPSHSTTNIRLYRW